MVVITNFEKLLSRKITLKQRKFIGEIVYLEIFRRLMSNTFRTCLGVTTHSTFQLFMFFSYSFLECQPSGMAAYAEEGNTELAEYTEVTVCSALPRLGFF